MASLVKSSLAHITCVLTLLSLTSGCALMPHAGGPPGFPPAPVEVQEAKSVPVQQSSEYLARLISRQSVFLQPRVAGNISQIYVKAGDWVTKGQPLLLIDPSHQDALVNQSSAASASAKADISQATANLTTVAEKRKATLSNLELSQKQFQRYTNLYAKQAASKQDLEKATDTLKQAQAADQEAAAQIASQKALITSTQKRYQQAVSGQQAEQVQRAFYTIKAPFSGQIGDVPVRVGMYIQSNTQLLSVTDNRSLEINIDIPSEKVNQVHSGQSVVLLDGDGKALGTAHLSFVSPRVDQGTQTVLAKAILSNPKGQFKADQTIRAQVVWGTAPGFLVPTSAVVHMAGQSFVFVATHKDKGTVAQQKPVVVGDIQGDQYTVKQGLQEGDQVITGGVQKLMDGAPIIPQSHAGAVSHD